MDTENDGDVREDREGQTIYQLMPKVAESIGAIHKSRFNEGQSFNFRGIDDVMTAVQPALVEWGVFYVPEVINAEHERYQTSRGTGMRSATLTVRYTFYGPLGDSVVGVGIGEAADAGDKATSKALAMALKYALLQTFCVPVGDPDPDAQNVEGGSSSQARPRRARSRSAQSSTPKAAVAPTVQGWLDQGRTRAEIIRAASEAARAHGDKPPTKIEQINVDTLKAETLAALTAAIKELEGSSSSEGANAAPGGSQELSQADPPGCADHDPYEPQCEECKAALASRQGSLAGA